MKYQVVLIKMSEDNRKVLAEKVVYNGTNKAIARATEYRYNGNVKSSKGFNYSFAEFREIK